MRNNKFWPVFALVWLAAAVVPYVDAQTLKEAVEQAVQTNPEVLVTTNRRLAADEGVKEARGGYWPQVDLLTGKGRERLDDINARALGLSDTTSTRRESSIVLSQMVFDGFGVKSEVARRRALVDSSAYDVAATAEDLALRVAGVYLDVLRRQETVAAAVDSLEVHQRIYDHIKLRSDSGVGRRADLDQAEGRLALAKVNLRSEQSDLKDATTTYLRLVGEAPRSLLKPPSLEQGLPLSEGLALDTALANNPTIKSAQADVAAADAQLAVAKPVDGLKRLRYLARSSGFAAAVCRIERFDPRGLRQAVQRRATHTARSAERRERIFQRTSVFPVRTIYRGCQRFPRFRGNGAVACRPADCVARRRQRTVWVLRLFTQRCVGALAVNDSIHRYKFVDSTLSHHLTSSAAVVDIDRSQSWLGFFRQADK